MTTQSDQLQQFAFPTELGWMALAGENQVLHELTFGHSSPQKALAALSASHTAPVADWNPELRERLQSFAAGEAEDFSDVALADEPATGFAAEVIRQCRAIPHGETRTYGELAALAGSPRAARAVGNLMARNRTPLVVPCHRVVPTSGNRLGGYSAAGGTRMKLRLLETEAQVAVPG